MWNLHRIKVNLAFVVNPFYLYCLSFALAIFAYLWGWSQIFPKLSAGLISFFAISFILFVLAGKKNVNKEFVFINSNNNNKYLNDIIFWLIIFLGVINVLFMWYLPILNKSHNYREFGMPVIDPLFNTLSIFFSVFFFQHYLANKKKRLLIYVLIILIVQILLFRRSALIWILVSSSFLFLIYRRRISLFIIVVGFISIPLFSYFFGFYGNLRSNLTKSFVLNDLGASEGFKNSGINHNHYMTYLYVASPLANLQENIDQGKGFLNNGNFKDFFFIA